jgi:hypothetical protein
MNGLEARIRRAYDVAKPVELADVHRALRTRRRRRIRAAAAVVVVAVTASAAVVAQTVGGSSKDHAIVAGPTRGARSGLRSLAAEHSTARRGGLTVRFVLFTPTVRVGGTLRGRLIITSRKPIYGCPPSSFPLSVTSTLTGRQVPLSSLPLCSYRRIAIPAGTTNYTIDQTALYQACSETVHGSTKRHPYCGPGTKGAPALPAGRYKVAPAVQLGNLLPLLPTPAAVTLTITGSPSVGGHLPEPTPKSAAMETTVVGTLEAVGGAAPGKPRPLAGTVTLQGPDRYTVPVTSNGRFRAEVTPGRYTLTGRSPAYQGGAAACQAADTVKAVRGVTTSVDVLCQER